MVHRITAAALTALVAVGCQSADSKAKVVPTSAPSASSQALAARAVYTSKEHGFRIAFPVGDRLTPKVEALPPAKPDPDVVSTVSYYTSEGDSAFAVEVTTFSAQVFQRITHEMGVAVSRKEMLGNTKTLLRESKSTVKGLESVAQHQRQWRNGCGPNDEEDPLPKRAANRWAWAVKHVWGADGKLRQSASLDGSWRP
jgi:hypothetical protein